jgi:ABC-type branched-subunit amino acid transport system permease subunit
MVFMNNSSSVTPFLNLNLTPNPNGIVYGISLTLVVLFMPGGILQAFQTIKDKFFKSH